MLDRDLCEEQIDDMARVFVAEAKEDLNALAKAGKKPDDSGAFRIKAAAITPEAGMILMLIDNGSLRVPALLKARQEHNIVGFTLVYDGWHTQSGKPRCDAIMTITRFEWGVRKDSVVRYQFRKNKVLYEPISASENPSNDPEAGVNMTDRFDVIFPPTVNFHRDKHPITKERVIDLLEEAVREDHHVEDAVSRFYPNVPLKRKTRKG